MVSGQQISAVTQTWHWLRILGRTMPQQGIFAALTTRRHQVALASRPVFGALFYQRPSKRNSSCSSCLSRPNRCLHRRHRGGAKFSACSQNVLRSWTGRRYSDGMRRATRTGKWLLTLPWRQHLPLAERHLLLPRFRSTQQVSRRQAYN